MTDTAATIVRIVEEAAYRTLTEQNRFDLLDEIRERGYAFEPDPASGVFEFRVGSVVVLRCHIGPDGHLERLN